MPYQSLNFTLSLVEEKRMLKRAGQHQNIYVIRRPNWSRGEIGRRRRGICFLDVFRDKTTRDKVAEAKSVELPAKKS